MFQVTLTFDLTEQRSANNVRVPAAALSSSCIILYSLETSIALIFRFFNLIYRGNKVQNKILRLVIIF